LENIHTKLFFHVAINQQYEKYFGKLCILIDKNLLLLLEYRK